MVGVLQMPLETDVAVVVLVVWIIIDSFRVFIFRGQGLQFKVMGFQLINMST